MNAAQKATYERILQEMKIRAKANEPKDPHKLALFELEQSACARISARKFTSFREMINDHEEEPEDEN